MAALPDPHVLENLPNVAFCGGMGAGKTTCADYLVQRYGYLPLHFASVLKNVSQAIWGAGAATDREKLQRLGVAVRDIDEDAWVNAALREMEYMREHGKNVILEGDVGGRIEPRDLRVTFDDLRFPNEYWALKERGFVIVRVVADVDIRVDRLQRNGKLQDISQLEHESEHALDAYLADYVIRNNANDNEYQRQLDGIVTKEVTRA